MNFDIDKRGNLAHKGTLVIELKDFQTIFSAKSLKRQKLIDGFLVFIEGFQKSVTNGFVVWIDGSVVSTKNRTE